MTGQCVVGGGGWERVVEVQGDEKHDEIPMVDSSPGHPGQGTVWG